MEVMFEPYKKISFRSYLRYDSAEQFVSVISMGTPPGIPARSSLFWANGILFRFFSFPPSEIIAKENVNGNIIWDHVEFAPMPTYQREIQGSGDRPLVTVSVFDMTQHVVFDPLTKWISKNLI